jgi:hypothetical protein
MKTKTFLLLFLLSGIGLTQLYAQGNQTSSDTRTYSDWKQVPWFYPVYCDGVQIDFLSGTIEYSHQVEHYVDGELKFYHRSA